MEKALKTKRILDNKKATQKKMGEQNAAKRDVGLIVSDIDGTITNFWKMFVNAGDKATDELVASRQKLNPDFKRETLVKEIVELGNIEFYKHNFPRVMKQLPCLKPRNEEERKAFAKDDAKIAHNWEKRRADLGKAFTGFFQTINKHKAAGGKFVPYTDSPVSSTMLRLQLMGMKPEQIDAIYTVDDNYALGNTPNRKEPEEGPLIKLNSKQQEWADHFKGRTVTIPIEKRKPNPEMFARICKEMGVPPKNAIMIGDMPNDIETVKGTGGISVWQKQGLDAIDKEVVATYNKMNPEKNYSIGPAAVEKTFAEKGIKPDVVWKNGFSDFDKFFRSVDAKTLQPPTKKKEISALDIANKKAATR